MCALDLDYCSNYIVRTLFKPVRSFERAFLLVVYIVCFEKEINIA